MTMLTIHLAIQDDPVYISEANKPYWNLTAFSSEMSVVLFRRILVL
jgi:hypothetical protein